MSLEYLEFSVGTLCIVPLQILKKQAAKHSVASGTMEAGIIVHQSSYEQRPSTADGRATVVLGGPKVQ